MTYFFLIFFFLISHYIISECFPIASKRDLDIPDPLFDTWHAGESSSTICVARTSDGESSTTDESDAEASNVEPLMAPSTDFTEPPEITYMPETIEYQSRFSIPSLSFYPLPNSSSQDTPTSSQDMPIDPPEASAPSTSYGIPRAHSTPAPNPKKRKTRPKNGSSKKRIPKPFSFSLSISYDDDFIWTELAKSCD